MISERRLLLVAGLLLAASSPCLGYQSGSRSAGPSGGLGTQVFVPSVASPSFSAPQSVISAPHNFAAPAPVGSVLQTPVTEFMPAQPSFQYQGQLASPTVIYQQPMPYPTGPTTQTVLQPRNGSSEGSSIVPKASLVDPIFEINDPYSPYAVDHSTWDCLLARYLVSDSTGVNRLRYSRVTAQDRNGLKSYLRYLQSIDTRTLNRHEQLAFWFNLYNARTVDIVLDNFPIRSIRQVKTKFTDFVGPFDDPGAVNVLGKPLSLNDIESGIIRPVWKDPRIHYALNCASYGCPNLAPRAWTAANLDSQLNGAAYEYINSNRAIRRGVLGVKVSKIFKWYKADFGGNDEAVLNHLRQYANTTTQQKLSGQRNIRGYFYNWSLNAAR